MAPSNKPRPGTNTSRTGTTETPDVKAPAVETKPAETPNSKVEAVETKPVETPDVKPDAAETKPTETKTGVREWINRHNAKAIAALCKEHPIDKCTAQSVVLCSDVALGAGDRPAGTFLGYLSVAPGIEAVELINALRNMNLVTCTPVDG